MLVHSVFKTVQGEGSRVGQPAIFIRLSGCNYWSGLQQDRGSGTGVCSRWCDTEFTGGEEIGAYDLTEKALDLAGRSERVLVVITGGEPMLQLRTPEGLELCQILRDEGAQVAIETNGSIAISKELRPYLNHVTVSPKAHSHRESASLNHVRQRSGTDLKVIVPTSFPLRELEGWDFENFYLQPRDDGTGKRDNLEEALEMVWANPGWKLSAQVHKYLGLP